jgi:hypothetical protein
VVVGDSVAVLTANQWAIARRRVQESPSGVWSEIFEHSPIAASLERGALSAAGMMAFGSLSLLAPTADAYPLLQPRVGEALTELYAGKQFFDRLPSQNSILTLWPLAVSEETAAKELYRRDWFQRFTVRALNFGRGTREYGQFFKPFWTPAVATSSLSPDAQALTSRLDTFPWALGSVERIQLS